MTGDQRFQKFNDPKYHKPKNYLKKTEVDERFEAVFDPRFEVCQILYIYYLFTETGR